MMNTWGGKVFPSPSEATEIGKKFLAEDPNTTGSLGLQFFRSHRKSGSDEHTKYALVFVLNHVKLHQTIIGQEAILQMEKAGDLPTSSLLHLVEDQIFRIGFSVFKTNFDEGKSIRCIASEPSSCPKLTRGVFLDMTLEILPE